MAVDAQISFAIPAVAIEIRGPVGVVDHKQVQPAIVVIVKPPGRYGPLVTFYSGFLGYIFEFSVAEITVEDIAVDARHEQISIAIIVVISRGCTHRIARAG